MTNLSRHGLRIIYESATVFKGGQACVIGLWRWSTMFEVVQHSMDQRLPFPTKSTKSQPPESRLHQSIKERVQLFSSMQVAFATMRCHLDPRVSRQYAQAHETCFHTQFMLLQSMFTTALQGDAQAMGADAFIALAAPQPATSDHSSDEQRVD